MTVLRGLCVGAGYFAQFHFDAWQRVEGARIDGVCDRDIENARRTADQVGARHAHADLAMALATVKPDFVDIITPPDSHRDLVSQCACVGVAVICQKPLAPDFATAECIVDDAEQAGIRLMVHENFRFQPWHRELKRLLDSGVVGDKLHSLSFRMRMGDGWGEEAYLRRQPYFRSMRRFLIHETGVHFVDVFRYLGGRITHVTARLQRLNSVIAGEDAAVVHFEFESGAVGLLDANRYNEPNYRDPRLTFGEFLIDANRGSLRLYGDGRITIQPLGEQERDHDYEWNNQGFAGDCVKATQGHFIRCLQENRRFETDGAEYLQTLTVVEAIYESDRSKSSQAIT